MQNYASFKAKFAGVEIEARDVVAQVLFVNIINLAAACRFVLHDEAHGNVFDLRIGLQAANLWLRAFGMRQDQNAGHPLDGL